GGAKVVWLKNANFLADDRTGGSERAKTGVENLLEVLKSGLPEGVTFLLSASGIDKRRAFYKWLNKNAECRVYDKIDISKDGWEDQVASLVSREAKSLGLRLAPDALDLFVQLCAEDTRQITSELKKIDLYLGPDEREIDLATVQKLVPLSRKGVIWEISRSLEARQPARAIQLIDEQLHGGESAIALIRASIIPTVRNLFYAKLATSAGSVSTANYRAFQGSLERLPPEKAAVLPRKKDGEINAWGLFQAAQAARKFTLAQLQQSLAHCLEADKALVTSSLDHRLVLHKLIARLV
ncbi:MAG: DNA polymerase III subunit delta, partial [Verrucomicrobiales bacterium]